MFSNERDLTYIFSPLSISKGIDVEGNVATVQTYDPATQTYTPDYTLTHLTLQPWLYVTDPDGVIATGRVEIANPVWSVIENGVKTAISSTSTQYAVTATGAGAGKLLVKRNATPDKPLSLIFTGEYTDTRTGRLYKIEMSHTVECSSTGIDVKCGIDQPKMTRYDPVRETSTVRKVHPWMTAGGSDVPAANRKFVWYKKDQGDTAYHVLGSSIMDYDATANADGSELTVDLTLIGERIDLRCYMFYNPYGAVTDTTIKSDTRYVDLAFLRCKGGYKVYAKAFRLMNRGVKSILAECEVRDSKGIIDNPDTYFDIEWKVSTGKADGSVSYGSAVATGSSARIPLTAMSASYGGTMKADATPKRPLAALTDSTGAVLTDASGNILVG